MGFDTIEIHLVRMFFDFLVPNLIHTYTRRYQEDCGIGGILSIPCLKLMLIMSYWYQYHTDTRPLHIVIPIPEWWIILIPILILPYQYWFCPINTDSALPIPRIRDDNFGIGEQECNDIGVGIISLARLTTLDPIPIVAFAGSSPIFVARNWKIILKWGWAINELVYYKIRRFN